ncbi:MAG TPA: lactonase family protein [Gemmataceae bacterium]|nr:lactonase family protein [Gemmataceae bacterium]
MNASRLGLLPAIVLLFIASGCGENNSSGPDKEAKIKASLDKLDPADRTLAEEQKYCAVETENRLGKMGKPIKIMVKDQPVFLCCKGCEERALADPDATLATVAKLKAANAQAKTTKFWVYIGSYTGEKSKSKGIYRCEFDAATGKLSEPMLAAEMTNPSFLAIHPNHRSLYAVGETGEFEGKPSGAVTAFSIDPESGELKRLNQKPSSGAGPCHVVVDKKGKNVLLANYGAGSAAVLRIEDDGRLGERTAFAQHSGKGTDPARQEGPHAHSINLDAANHYAFVADLGLDQVFVYRFDSDKGSLEKNEPPSAKIEPKSGPRHFAFHPNGRYAYVINELANTVTAMKYDAEKGVLTPIQTISTLPEGYNKQSWTAEVQVHPSGKFLYGSNRGHNSIAVFTIDEKTGKLTAAGHQDEGIKTPRNFGIDPTGKFVLVANQDGDSILVFRVDGQTGALQATGEKVEVGKPVCVKFLAK